MTPLNLPEARTKLSATLPKGSKKESQTPRGAKGRGNETDTGNIQDDGGADNSPDIIRDRNQGFSTAIGG